MASVAAVVDTPYGVDAIEYKANDSECANTYDDTFTYKAVDESSLESTTASAKVTSSKFCQTEFQVNTETVKDQN